MTIQELDRQLSRLEAAEACRNLAARLMYYHTASYARGLLELWSHRGDETFLSTAGRLTGFEAIAETIRRRCGGDRAGVMDVHETSTEVLTIAEDGTSAQGIWLSLGCSAAPDRTCRWVWDKLAMTFLRTEEGWRIHDLTVYPVLDTPYGGSFANLPAKPQITVGDTTYHGASLKEIVGE